MSGETEITPIGSEGVDGSEVFTEPPIHNLPNTETKVDTPPSKEPAVDQKTESAPAAPYVPNLKFKAFDKEHEIDEFFKPLIKDPESEKKVREIYEKSMGLDHYKNKYTSVEQRVLQQEKHYGPIVKALEEVSVAYKQGDLDTVFAKMQIPEKQIFDWVAEKIRLSELPPEEKAVYDERQKARQQASQLQAANSQLAEQQAVYQAQARAYELDQSLAKADVKDLASMWDSLYGENAFKQEVIQTGQFEFYRSKRDLSPQEAINQTLQKIKPVIDKIKMGSQTSNSSSQRQIPVIPNPQGRSGSPAKPVVKSLADIKKLADSMP